MHNKSIYMCRICGFEHSEPPWGDRGEIASFDICDCCGVEFGYEDSTLLATKKYRDNWLLGGAKWFDSNQMPKNWCIENQMKNIPDVFC